jgi:malonate decarboxylase gamma subunit
VFAPGVQNFVRMGGVRSVWGSTGTDGLTAGLREALLNTPTEDLRAADGRSRGGRRLAADVAEQVLAAD